MGGATARIFEVLNGNLIWETQLHKPESGILTYGLSSGVGITFDKVDVFVLTNGHVVRRLDAAKGGVTWGWTSADAAYVQNFRNWPD